MSKAASKGKMMFDRIAALHEKGKVVPAICKILNINRNQYAGCVRCYAPENWAGRRNVQRSKSVINKHTAGKNIGSQIKHCQGFIDIMGDNSDANKCFKPAVFGKPYCQAHCNKYFIKPTMEE